MTPEEAREIRALAGRVVLHHAAFVATCGSLSAALFASQALFWTERTKDRDGWFYKSERDWREELGLTRRELEGARKKLKAREFLEETRKGRVPATLHYRLTVSFLSAARQFFPNLKIDRDGASTPHCAKRANRSGHFVQTSEAGMWRLNKEAESTAEITRHIKTGTAETCSQMTRIDSGLDRLPPDAGEVDPRYAIVRDAIKRLQRYLLGYETWDGTAGRKLRELLRSTTAPAERLVDCVVGRAMTRDLPFAEHPQRWLGRLVEFQEGPLDRYGRLVRSDERDPGGWDAQREYEELLSVATGREVLE